MESIRSLVHIDLKVNILLNEEETRALDAIVGYGTESFLKVFYEKMGKHYLKPHEKGLISLFENIRRTLPSHLIAVDTARKLVNPMPKVTDGKQ